MQSQYLTNSEKEQILGEILDNQVKLWNKEIKKKLLGILYFLERVEIDRFLTKEVLYKTKEVALEIDFIFKDNRTSKKLKEKYDYNLIQDLTVLGGLYSNIYTLNNKSLDRIRDRKNNILKKLKDIIENL